MSDQVGGEAHLDQRHLLVEDRPEDAADTLVGVDLDVGALVPPVRGARGDAPCGELGVDVEHLRLPLLVRRQVGAAGYLEAADSGDLHGVSFGEFNVQRSTFKVQESNFER